MIKLIFKYKGDKQKAVEQAREMGYQSDEVRFVGPKGASRPLRGGFPEIKPGEGVFDQFDADAEADAIIRLDNHVWGIV